MASIGSAPGLLVGAAVGAAAGAAFEPAFEVPRQDAWHANPNRILDAGLLARLVAQGGIDLSAAHAEALRDGFQSDKVDALVYLAQTVPGVAEAFDLWRKGLIGDALFTHALVKAGLDQRYIKPVQNLKTAELIGIGDVAYGVVRGILPDEGLLPVSPPTSGTSVPRFPQSSLSPIDLAAALGYDKEQLRIMVGRSGLSLAPGLAATARFRKLINADDYLLAIAEGDLRTEWADTLFEASRQIPTARDGVQKHLRGWTDAAGMYEIARRHGMQDTDTDTLFQIERRPLNIHAITTGLARGGQFNPAAGEIQDPYVASSHQSDLGPEWYDLNEANKYVYPSAFVLRSLAQAGDLGGQAAVEQVLLEIGWKPSFATKVSTAWTTPSSSGSGTDPHLAKAQTQVWTATHKAYVDQLVSDATATASLTAAGVGAAAVPQVLALWREERDLIRKSLSASQIKKAWFEQIPDPALGRPWTEAEAVERLTELGYTADDARLLLAE